MDVSPARRHSGVGLAFGPAAFEEELARRYAHVEAIETLRRRVGDAELETYTLFRSRAAERRREGPRVGASASTPTLRRGLVGVDADAPSIGQCRFST